MLRSSLGKSQSCNFMVNVVKDFLCHQMCWYDVFMISELLEQISVACCITMNVALRVFDFWYHSMSLLMCKFSWSLACLWYSVGTKKRGEERNTILNQLSNSRLLKYFRDIPFLIEKKLLESIGNTVIVIFIAKYCENYLVTLWFSDFKCLWYQNYCN